MQIGSPSLVTEDGVEWERYPIYAPAGPLVPHQHLVKFITPLPAPPPKRDPVSGASLPAPPTPSAANPHASPPLLYPFSSSIRLCSPRHIDYRSKFVNRQKLMKQMQSQANAQAKATAAGAKETTEDEGIEPTERKWRLEPADAKAAAKQEQRLLYLGARDVPPRKDTNTATASHNALLLRQEGRFLLVPYDTYSFRHVDNDSSKLTLEEAEQKMKLRVKRFEKRVKSMTTLQAHHDEEEAESGPTSAAAGGGGGGGVSGGMALARARPTLTAKAQTEKVEKADDAFADAPASSGRSKAGTLSRKAKAKKEEGSDYVRQFDDDDVDGTNDDRLDGQGGEASDREDDAEETLAARQQEAELDAAATARKNQANQIAAKVGLTMDEAEQEQEWANDDDDDEEEEEKKDGTPAKRVAASRKDDDDDDEDVQDSDLSLSDNSDDEESDVKMKTEPTSSAASNSRKRPASPATSSNGAASSAPTQQPTKKVKIEGGSIPSNGGAAAAAAAPLTPAELAEMERLVISEFLAAPAGTSYTSKSLVSVLTKRHGAVFNKRTAAPLRDILKKVASLLPDKTHIILKKEYQNK